MVQLLSTPTCVGTLAAHSEGVNSVAFTPCGRTLVSGSSDKTVRLWDIESNRTAVLNGHTHWVTCVCVSKDGRTAASAGYNDYSVILWDLGSQRCIIELLGHTAWVHCVCFHPTEPTLASGSSDSTIRLWDVKSGTHKATLIGHLNKVYALSYSPDGTRLASGSSDGTAALWDTRSNECTNVLKHSFYVYSVTFADGAHLLSASADRNIRVWDLTTGTCTRILRGHDAPVHSVAMMNTPEGLSYAISAADNNTVKIWDWRREASVWEWLGGSSGACVVTLQGHGSNALYDRTWDCWGSLAVSPDGRTIAVPTTNDNFIRLWKIAE